MNWARLRRMTFEEGRWRTRETARTLGDRIRFRVARPRWPEAKETSVANAIADRLARGQSRCVIDPALADAVRDAVLMRWPDAAADAAARGDRIIAGQYDLLGYRGLRFSDWHSDPVHRRTAPRTSWAEVPYLHPAVGDHKIIWEFNRHQHWLKLGRAFWLTRDQRYAREIVRQLESWLDDNPPLTGINWASMLEIGFRAISWTMALHFLATGRHQLPAARFFAAIDRQLAHVEQHLSYYFSPNTHLTGEALALYVVGQAFPEMPASQRWVTTGRRILLREIERQILPDGGHAERSTHYQRYTLDFYLLALLTARRAADVDAARTFTHTVSRLADFTRAMADDDGRLPLIGDDDGGMLWPIAGRECNDVRDSLAVAAAALDRPDLAPWGIPEEAFWIAAPEALASNDRIPDPGSRLPASITLPHTGYVVLRDAEGGHAVLDAGAHGYMNGGHAHADALSLTLRLGKRSLLVDPGTSTYTLDPRLRDRMRGSFNHNTLSIDGRTQSIPAGPFHWTTSAAARIDGSRHAAGFDWVEAVHDGYAPLEHRRSIVRAEGAGWLIVDELGGDAGEHAAAAHWHFDPSWMVQADGHGRLRASHLEGDEAWLLFDQGQATLLHGDEPSGLGWFAPVYGTLVPTWTARITRTNRLPFSMLTWIGDGGGAAIPTLERLDVTAEPGGGAIAARVRRGEFTSTYLLHGRNSGVADYQTDARVMHVRTRGDALVALDLIDVTNALALRDGWLSIAASEPLAGLHARLDGGALRLATSQPPRELRIDAGTLTFVIRPQDWVNSPSGPLFHFGAPFALEGVAPGRCEEISPLRESSW